MIDLLFQMFTVVWGIWLTVRLIEFFTKEDKEQTGHDQ